MYFTCDDQGSILAVNETLAATLQFQREQLIGAHVNTIFPVSTRIFYNTHAFPLLKVNGQISEIFMYLRNAAGEQVPALVNAIRTTDTSAVNKFVAMKVDNRNKYESELIAARNEAQQIAAENSMLKSAQESLRKKSIELDEALSSLQKQHDDLKQLNKIVTHDLQEPMRKLFFYTGMLKDSPQESEMGATVSRIERSSLRLKAVLTALQEYIWLGDRQLKIEKVDLNNVVAKVKTELEKEFPGLQVNWQIGALPECEGDEPLIFALYYHLLKNAVQYGKPGKVNVIKVSSTPVTENVFRHSQDNYDFMRYNRVTIEDNGIGFPVEDNEVNAGIQLFRRWNQQSGIGLGLAMSRKIAELHKGRLMVSSTVDAGTRVDIYWRAHAS
jgi:sigma-B regulation protein RsbU (phosphoserine phosphatase)